LDRPAKQQQFLGQGGLAGVRMRNDRKGTPAGNLVGQGARISTSLLPGVCAIETAINRSALGSDMMAAPPFANRCRTAREGFLARGEVQPKNRSENYHLPLLF
jgi:hypothetical protein